MALLKILLRFTTSKSYYLKNLIFSCCKHAIAFERNSCLDYICAEIIGANVPEILTTDIRVNGNSIHFRYYSCNRSIRQTRCFRYTNIRFKIICSQSVLWYVRKATRAENRIKSHRNRFGARSFITGFELKIMTRRFIAPRKAKHVRRECPTSYNKCRPVGPARVSVRYRQI